MQFRKGPSPQASRSPGDHGPPLRAQPDSALELSGDQFTVAARTLDGSEGVSFPRLLWNFFEGRGLTPSSITLP